MHHLPGKLKVSAASTISLAAARLSDWLSLALALTGVRVRPSLQLAPLRSATVFIISGSALQRLRSLRSHPAGASHAHASIVFALLDIISIRYIQITSLSKNETYFEMN